MEPCVVLKHVEDVVENTWNQIQWRYYCVIAAILWYNVSNAAVSLGI